MEKTRIYRLDFDEILFVEEVDKVVPPTQGADLEGRLREAKRKKCSVGVRHLALEGAYYYVGLKVERERDNPPEIGFERAFKLVRVYGKSYVERGLAIEITDRAKLDSLKKELAEEYAEDY